MSANFRVAFSGIGKSPYILSTRRLVRESEAFWCRLLAGYFVFLSAFCDTVAVKVGDHESNNDRPVGKDHVYIGAWERRVRPRATVVGAAPSHMLTIGALFLRSGLQHWTQRSRLRGQFTNPHVCHAKPMGLRAFGVLKRQHHTGITPNYWPYTLANQPSFVTPQNDLAGHASQPLPISSCLPCVVWHFLLTHMYLYNTLFLGSCNPIGPSENQPHTCSLGPSRIR
jgi:hypothetical protein